ncbi:MAG TPA: peptidase S9, partial [Bacteroidales bacterium]|nr:peptidase S9 [Bacteroidales bacterium]
MKRSLFLLMITIISISVACKQQPPVLTKEPVAEIGNQLTAEEKSGGVMTPEIMWKFGRLGSFALSPDGSSVLYTVTKIDLKSEARKT